jgi:uncharacterized protein YmfQ (DUF2313 family)
MAGARKSHGTHFRSLMDQLIKGMLAICARFSPNDRSCLIIDRITFAVNGLSIAFHIALLKVSGKSVKVLIVGKYRFRCCMRKNYCTRSQVEPVSPAHFFQKVRIPEMIVHRMRSFEQLNKIVRIR